MPGRMKWGRVMIKDEREKMMREEEKVYEKQRKKEKYSQKTAFR